MNGIERCFFYPCLLMIQPSMFIASNRTESMLVFAFCWQNHECCGGVPGSGSFGVQNTGGVDRLGSFIFLVDWERLNSYGSTPPVTPATAFVVVVVVVGGGGGGGGGVAAVASAAAAATAAAVAVAMKLAIVYSHIRLMPPEPLLANFPVA